MQRAVTTDFQDTVFPQYKTILFNNQSSLDNYILKSSFGKRIFTRNYILGFASKHLQIPQFISLSSFFCVYVVTGDFFPFLSPSAMFRNVMLCQKFQGCGEQVQGHCDKHNLSAAPKQGNTFNNVLGRLIHPPHGAGLAGSRD